MTVKQTLEYSGFIFLILLSLSVCVSKSAVDISTGVLFLISILYSIRHAGRVSPAHNHFPVILMIPLAIGFIISFFSLAGPVSGATAFLERYRFFFLIIPFTLFAGSEKNIVILFWALNISAFIAVVYGFGQLNIPHVWGNAIGFYPLLRGSGLLMSIGLLNLVGLISYRCDTRIYNIISKILIALNTVLVLTAVLLMMRRGAYLGFLVGLSAFLIMLRKKWLIAGVVVAVCASLFLSDGMVVQRIKTITDENYLSNRVRVQVFRSGVDFLKDEGLFFHGTGGKKAVKPHADYYYSQSSEYQARHVDIRQQQYFGNFHNSFLQMAVEYGLFFLLIYLAGIGYMLVFFFRRIHHLGGNQKLFPMAAIVVTAGFFASQFFHTDLYSYGGLPFILAFAAGCHVTNRRGIMETETGAKGVGKVIA